MLQLNAIGFVLTGIVTGCQSFWRPGTDSASEPGGAAYETVDLANWTPLC